MADTPMVYNKNSPAVRRLMRELLELQSTPSPMFHAAPLADNLFEWHFTIRGSKDTAFEGGKYHGRLLLPSEYPFKPPNIILLTPNGRFELNTKICLSITGYHPEFWQPAWGVRTALLALISFLPTKGEGAIGALDWTDAERQRLARSSGAWRCQACEQTLDEILPGDGSEEAASERDAVEDVSMFQIRYERDATVVSAAEPTTTTNAPVNVGAAATQPSDSVADATDATSRADMPAAEPIAAPQSISVVAPVSLATSATSLDPTAASGAAAVAAMGVGAIVAGSTTASSVQEPSPNLRQRPTRPAPDQARPAPQRATGHVAEQNHAREEKPRRRLIYDLVLTSLAALLLVLIWRKMT